MDATGFLKIETPTVTEPWRKVLLDAADYIEAHGWCPETERRPCGVGKMGEVCPAVAVVMVMPDEATMEEANERFEKWSGGECFVAYNGHCKTAAEVCEALRQCARS